MGTFQDDASAIPEATLGSMGGRARYPSVLVYLVLFLISLASLTWLRPPAVDSDPGPAEFDVARAMQDLQVIASEPHPTESPANSRVRAFLVDRLKTLGFDMDVQRAAVYSGWRGETYTVENVIARLQGSGRGRAVALAAHYDSVAGGPGAADDGAAVAALLEASRVLGAEGPFKNDLILLITDGEEDGLLGAVAFVKNHAWRDDIGVLFNFEARGTSGASIMFETSSGNSRLIDDYARLAPHPIASSLSGDVYRRMPNLTDFTVFADAGLRGLNFAFIGSPEHYHTAQDDVAHLDPRSLQHHGIQALALARHYLDADLDEIKSADDCVFFSVPLIGIIRYPISWSLWIGIAPMVGTVALLVNQLRSRVARLKGTIKAVIGLIVAGVIIWATALIQLSVFDELDVMRNTDMTIGGAIAVGMCCMGLLSWMTMRWAGRYETLLAACLLVGVASAAAAWYSPGGSYLISWPAVFLCFATCVEGWNVGRGMAIMVVELVCAIPAIVLILPLCYLAYLGLGVSRGVAVQALVVLMMLCLMPCLFPPRAESVETRNAVVETS